VNIFKIPTYIHDVMFSLQSIIRIWNTDRDRYSVYKVKILGLGFKCEINFVLDALDSANWILYTQKFDLGIQQEITTSCFQNFAYALLVI